MIVHMNEEFYSNLVIHGLQKLPEEACGFILGEESPTGELIAHSFIPLRNCASNPRSHFEVNPEEMIPFLMDRTKPVIGLFHTHPTAPPIPSNMDLQTLWHSIPTHWILSFLHPEQPELQLYQIKKTTPTSYHKLSFVIG